MTDRPGGWVEGIGWVAWLHDLTGGTWFITSHESDGQALNFWRSPADEFVDNVLVIVTRWSDGSTPEPTKRPDEFDPTTIDESAGDDLSLYARPQPPKRLPDVTELPEWDALFQHQNLDRTRALIWAVRNRVSEPCERCGRPARLGPCRGCIQPAVDSRGEN